MGYLLLTLHNTIIAKYLNCWFEFVCSNFPYKDLSQRNYPFGHIAILDIIAN